MLKNLSLNNVLKKFGVIIALLLLVLMLFVEINSARQESQIIDEGPHLAAGYSYLVNQNIELNPEHPPLVKLISGLFISPLKPIFPWTDLKSENQWDVGDKFFYDLGNNADQMLFWGRLPIMLLSCLLGWLIFNWTRQLAGIQAGLIALILYIFDANILAHSRYITTDLAISLGFVATLYFFYKYSQKTNLKNLFIFFIVFALTQITKFSAILLWPMIVFFGLFLGLKKKQYYSLLGGCAISTLVVILIFYFGHIETYIDGIIRLAGHEQGGHYSYLLGQYDLHGFWYYFPIAFIVKTPLIIILLLLLALPFFVQKIIPWIKLSFAEYLIISFPLFYFIASMINRLNIGIRHILPIYPFIFIFIAVYLFQKTINKKHKIIKIISLILILFFIIESLIIYPNYLSYFSPLVGGSSQGHKYLLDSNLDWGQDLKKLKKYLDENNIEEKIYLSYFGKASPDYYNINYRWLEPEIKKGYFAISIGRMMEPGFSHQYLLYQKPLAKIGGSIYLYHVE